MVDRSQLTLFLKRGQKKAGHILVDGADDVLRVFIGCPWFQVYTDHFALQVRNRFTVSEERACEMGTPRKFSTGNKDPTQKFIVID